MKISNRVLVGTLLVFSKFNRHGNMYALSHEKLNKDRLKERFGDIFDRGDLLENQNSYYDIYIGLSTVAEAGCEAIATYNALRLMLDEKQDSLNEYTHRLSKEYKKPCLFLWEIIRRYEKRGIMYAGKFGVSPKAVVDVIKDMGYDVKVFIPDKKNHDIESFAMDNKVMIMTYYNNKYDLYDQLHTIAIGRSERGYRAYNVYGNGNSHGYFMEISDLIRALGNGNAFPIILLGIKEKA